MKYLGPHMREITTKHQQLDKVARQLRSLQRNMRYYRRDSDVREAAEQLRRQLARQAVELCDRLIWLHTLTRATTPAPLTICWQLRSKRLVYRLEAMR